MTRGARPCSGVRATAIAALSSVLALFGSRTARAQLMPAQELARWPSVVGSVAFEPEPVVNAAYLHPIAASLFQRGASFAGGGGFKVPLLSVWRGDFRVQALAAASLRPAPNWGGTCSTLPFLARAENDAGAFYGLGIELRCQPTYSRGSWAFGIDLGWQDTVTTYIHHSASTRRTFDDRYPAGVDGIAGPHDGWYRFTSERFRFGLMSSHRFSEKWAGAVALGALLTRQDEGVYLPLIPFYIEVAASHGL